ncbi:hypothetical protein [uncultured Mesonia sp.]|uniref:hypothetical protein n=1 Tax=uncultured Mesonia sp. TaxID=399731 RepID=UPI00374FC5F8
MGWKSVNLEIELRKNREKNPPFNQHLEAIKKHLELEISKDEQIRKRLLTNHSQEKINRLNFDELDLDRIFHQEHIKSICTTYRLRFLPSFYFKKRLPQEVLIRIKALEQQHQIELNGFKIMAPASWFKLRNADDPLLFVPLGNGYYYLVHKWGNDLNAFRKLLMWPLKSLENFLLLLAAVSLLMGNLISLVIFDTGIDFFKTGILSLFIFKWIVGLALFYGFKMGKNFNTAVWDSTYFNA